MKKLITVFLAVAFVFSFVGCGLFQGDSTKVELTKTPKTQYVVGEELGSVEFGLKVTGGTTAGEYNFTYAEYTADTLPISSSRATRANIPTISWLPISTSLR